MTDTGYARLRLEVRVDEVDGVRTPQVVPLVDGRILGLGVEAHAVRGDYGRGMDPEAVRFDPGQYFEELIRADVDRWWEDVPRRVARHVVSVLDDRPGILGQWGFGLLGGRGWTIGDDGEVEISVVSPGGRHYLQFGCDPQGDPDAETGRILDRLGDTHPERLPATVRSTVV